MSKLTRRTVTGLLSSFLVAPAAFAQQSRVITIVVPFPPGGSTDAMARLLQSGLQDRLGTTVIIENKAGAVGSIGAAQVARSTPDGTSLLLTFDSHAVIPALVERPPVDVEKELLPVLLVGTAPYVIATNAERPYKTFADVIAAAKKAPGKISYASVGVGTIGHLAMTQLGKLAGTDITHVPYKGGGPAINDILGGHVDLIAGSAALITPQLSGGKLRPLLQTGKARLAALKDVPTAIESGFSGFEAVAWWGVFVPKGTPQAVITRTADAFVATLKEEAITRRLQDTQQIVLALDGPEKFGTFFDSQVKYWAKVVKDNGIQVN
jgi:tripartite-type tricarboxylate transporter receptor subunit TctC